VATAVKEIPRKYKTYLIVPAVITDGKKILNSAILLDRSGKMMGRYTKVHPVPDKTPAKTFEGGTTPGNDYPVFNLDFGKIGIQICFDYRFEEGWQELAKKGAELIVHTTMSPSVSISSARAVNNHVYVVSSTWRDNASIIEPTGMLAAQIKQPEQILVHEIDLEYRLLPWPSTGEKVREQYKEKIGFNYYPSEDLGIFWSNDPTVPIDSMVRWQGVWTDDEYVEYATKRYREFKGKSK
jgi:predicted amidohydrolase